MGISLGLASLADRPGLFQILSTLSFVLCTLGGLALCPGIASARPSPSGCWTARECPTPESGPVEE